MELFQLHSRQGKVYKNRFLFSPQFENNIFFNQTGSMAIEGVVISALLVSILTAFLKLNDKFDQHEKDSIKNFQKKWIELEERYGKAN